MGKIFVVMGKTSSGKDTVYKRVLDTLTLNQVYLKLVDGEFIPHISKKDNEKRGVLAVALLPNVDGTFD